jgi:hypothetical protein
MLRTAASALASALPENLLTRRSDPPRAKAALQAARKSSDVHEAVVLSMGRMQKSFTILGLRPRSSAALRKTPNAY